MRSRSITGMPDGGEPLIAAVNRIRRENAALHHNHTLRFHPTDNAHLIAYSKVDADMDSRVLVIANLDPVYPQHGFVDVDTALFGLTGPFTAEDLLTGERYLWARGANYVRLAEVKAAYDPDNMFRVNHNIEPARAADFRPAATTAAHDRAGA